MRNCRIISQIRDPTAAASGVTDVKLSRAGHNQTTMLPPADALREATLFRRETALHSWIVMMQVPMVLLAAFRVGRLRLWKMEMLEAA